MASVKTPRSAWVQAALEALATGGPDAVRVEALASRLGVTKGGFYWHFADRGALLTELLDAWETAVVEDVIARVDGGPADPRARLQQLFELATGVDVRVELALRDWARRDRDVEARVQRIDVRRMDYLRALFAPISSDEHDAEARSLLAFTLFLGSHLVGVGHGGLSRAQVLQLAVDRLLEHDPERRKTG